jgi:CheY-like chemotaxis protein
MKLLVVDDHATKRKLLRATFEAESHVTLEASNGIEALGVLARENVDTIISDIFMPNMDGFRLCHEVRKNERLRALPFIIYTGTYASADDKKLAENVGADKYLAKPAPAAAVLDALHEAIAIRASRLVKPAPALAENQLLEPHNQPLANELDQKHAELQPALVGLQKADDHIPELTCDLEQPVQNSPTRDL